MLSIKVICVGKLKEKFYVDAANEYSKRLSGYCKLEIIELPEDKQQMLEKECELIISKIPNGAVTIALCIEGKEIDSKGLSDMINDYAVKGISKLYFIIGGSVGLHEKIKKEAEFKLSMSKMTFPHNLARVMLLEQLYRAFKITEGGKYHK